jgi:hypothetical protein
MSGYGLKVWHAVLRAGVIDQAHILPETSVYLKKILIGPSGRVLSLTRLVIRLRYVLLLLARFSFVRRATVYQDTHILPIHPISFGEGWACVDG